MRIKKFFDKIAMKIGVTVAKKVSPVIREAIDNPENLRFEGYIDGDDIVIRIKVKD